MSTESSPAFQFYAKDWLSDSAVLVMTAEERGAYINLLCHCWIDGALPQSDHALAQLAGVKAGRQWARIRTRVMARFIAEPTSYRHKRLDEERVKQTEWRTKSALGGRASAEARRLKHGSAQPAPNIEPPFEADGSAVVQAEGSEPISNTASSSSSSSTPKPPKGVEGTEETKPETDAAWYLQQYPVWYAEERNGARYRVAEARDFPTAVTLVTQWPDRDYLERMTRLFLRATDLPAAHVGRTIDQFARIYASGTDAVLRQHDGVRA